MFSNGYFIALSVCSISSKFSVVFEIVLGCAYWKHIQYIVERLFIELECWMRRVGMR